MPGPRRSSSVDSAARYLYLRSEREFRERTRARRAQSQTKPSTQLDLPIESDDREVER